MRSWFIDIAGLGVSYGHGAALYLYCIDTANYYNFFLCMFANVLALDQAELSHVTYQRKDRSQTHRVSCLCISSLAHFFVG